MEPIAIDCKRCSGTGVFSIVRVLLVPGMKKVAAKAESAVCSCPAGRQRGVRVQR